jgi:hypothetical protein
VKYRLTLRITTLPRKRFSALNSVPPQQQQSRFFEYWTFKEAYIKARSKVVAPHGRGATFQQLLDIFNKNQALPPAQIGNIILNQSGDAIRYLARSVMLMWYLGSWYDPADLQKYNSPTPPTDPLGPKAIISSEAYTQGWAWSVAQAHLMGYSNFTFGYWSQQPPSLEDFIGGGS